MSNMITNIQVLKIKRTERLAVGRLHPVSEETSCHTLQGVDQTERNVWPRDRILHGTEFNNLRVWLRSRQRGSQQ